MHPHDPVSVATPEVNTITGLFRAQVARTPHSVALESQELSLSYSELDKWSDALARRLVAAGVRRGDLVGIRAIRRAETVVGLLGILKAGAAYLPLNPSDPSERLRRILEDAAPAAVVDPENCGHTDLPFAAPVLGVPGSDDDGGDALSVDAAKLTGEDLAYVCYTSGSTGQPKGVMIPHRGVARLVKNTNYIDIRPDDVFLQFAPLSFDASTFEIWGALLNGAKLVIYPEGNVDLGDLGRFIRAKKISTLWLTSALFNLMVDKEIESLLGVRCVLAGGDVLSVRHVKQLLGQLPESHVLINGYGPTENTTFTCCHRMDRKSVVGDRVPIGVPITGTDIVILDDKDIPVQEGAAGEILVGGSGLAKGYLNSPALDVEKFVSLAVRDGKRRCFYRTGDLGAWNPDGTVDFRGRIDDQVKIRGFRIEPAEIEAALRGLKGIRDASIALGGSETGEGQLRAFVVRDDTGLGADSIKAQLQALLPGYMVPAVLEFLDELPVTPNGKVDRAALGEMVLGRGNANAADHGDEPRDLLEHKMALIWSRLFRRERVGRNDNFFELGGHSLLAAQLAHEVEKLVGRRLPIALFFQAQTIAQLSEMLQSEEWAPAWSSLVPLRPEGEKAPLFLIHGHRGHVYVFLDLARALHCGRPIYGVQAVDAGGRQERHETVEQMAAHYAREIRSLQPDGPYHLAGFSLGGWIAYAVAHELRSAGQEVAFLGLLDTHATADVPWYHRWLTTFTARDPLRSMWYFFIRLRRTTTGYYDQLHARYRPPTYAGKGDVFVAREKTGYFFRLFWQRMLRGGARFHAVPGSHDDMLSPANCPALARKLEAALQSRCRDEETGTPLGPGPTVHRFFEEQVKKTPDAVAVEAGDESLTYLELNLRADRLAAVLAAAGAGPDEVVGIYAPMSPGTLVGVLAALKAGAAYLPVDMALPRARRAFLLQDSRCNILLVGAEHISQLMEDLSESELSARIVTLDATVRATAEAAEAAPVLSARPDNIAYVLYTSGSTGRPKGVEMPHRALVNLLGWQTSISSQAETRRTLQFANLSFDVSFQEIFATWTTGGTLVLIEGAARRDWEKLLRFIDQRKIDRLFLPFVVLENLAAAAGKYGLFPASIKEVFVAGEQLRISSSIRAFFGRIHGARLWNHYGPTETHVVTGFMLEGDPEQWPDLPPIGRPVPNCEVYLLDETLRSVPFGVPADLYISGVPLARGYRNRPELTAERFLPSAKEPNARMYKTGDVARMNSDGTIEFLGRSDSQVKIRGHRIEPGEIEVLLGKHADIANCAVRVEEGPAGKQLAAFIVPRDGANLSLASLREFLSKELPDYMIPTRFALLNALPLTPNGKVDREILGKGKSLEVSTGGEQTVPGHELEQRLGEIWKSLLSLQHVGVRDNFFALGGHSLLVAFCCAEIEKQLGVRVPLGLFYEQPTIAGLAEKLRGLPAEPLVLPAEDTDSAPLASFAQESMWFLQQYLPDAATYNQALAWRFEGPVDKERLQLSLETVMGRHDVLRSALVYEDGHLVQKLPRMEQSQLPWHETVLDSQVVLDDYLCTEARRPFDLACAPLWRCVWIQTSIDDHVLLLVFHHSIIDEWSMRLLVGELEQIYAGKVPAELPMRYIDYAAWERRSLASGRFDVGSAYWGRQLADVPPPIQWPASSGHTAHSSTGSGLTHCFRLDATVVAKFRSLARQEGVTSFVVMLAAFQLWLHRSTGREDIIVGTPFAERSRAEYQQLIGCFLNTLPIRTKFVRDESFCDLLRRVRQSALTAFDHADFPFAKMVELAVSQRGTAAVSLFQTMFVLLEQSAPAPRLGNANSRTLLCDTRTAKFDLTLFIDAKGETWDCCLEYSADLFSQADAAHMAREMADLFTMLAENPSLDLRRPAIG